MIIGGWIWRWRQRKKAQPVLAPRVCVGLGYLLLIGLLIAFWNSQNPDGQKFLLILFHRALPEITCVLVVVICVELIDVVYSVVIRSRRDK
jgi:hypothetical protein